MGAGGGMGALGALISFGLTVWFVIFSVLVIKKLDAIIEALGKK